MNAGRLIVQLIAYFLPKNKRARFIAWSEMDAVKSDTFPRKILSGILFCVIGIAFFAAIIFIFLKVSGEI
jgi:hypothetical protein